ncbi:hypothetical protein ACE1B6_08525 [Aerosakkonemataceae cyanobacterium BLCC-F154]|uniref:Uncharacterized protein n=1 Tax=Floridaenema fluviatile BLCC-F154 TaxID=3153640 RepID=A0ABV4Y9W4_9CYAN
METLAYLHCASTCEEIAPVEPMFGEDDAYLFDGVINVKKLSSLALLGLLPLSVAFSVMASPEAAQAGSCYRGGYSYCGGHHRPRYRVYKKVVYKKVVYKKVVYYYKKRYRKHYRCYRPRVRCKVVCYKVKPCYRHHHRHHHRHHYRPACY